MFRHDDAGILGYAKPERLVKRSLQARTGEGEMRRCCPRPPIHLSCLSGGFASPQLHVPFSLFLSQADPTLVEDPKGVLHRAAERKARTGQSGANRCKHCSCVCCCCVQTSCTSADPPLHPHPHPRTRQAAVEDVFEAIRFFETKKSARPPFDGRTVNGQWRLQFTTGTAEKAANANRRKGGSYFPLGAVQSFNAATGHIRNGIYAGPLSFFFDGPFVWDDQRKILEFTFDRVSLAWGSGKPLRFNIGEGAWEKVKGAEEAVSDGQGKIGKGGRKVNPFFKFVFADDTCIAARGRGGGLALWAKESSTPVEVDAEYYETRPKAVAGAASAAR